MSLGLHRVWILHREEEDGKIVGLWDSHLQNRVDARTLFLFMSLTQHSFWCLALHACLWLQGLGTEIMRIMLRTQGIDTGPGRGKAYSYGVDHCERVTETSDFWPDSCWPQCLLDGWTWTSSYWPHSLISPQIWGKFYWWTCVTDEETEVYYSVLF